MLPLLPVLLPLIAAAVALLLRRHWAAQVAVGQLALLGSLGATGVMVYRLALGHAPFVYQLGAWPAPAGITFIADLLSGTFVLMSVLVLNFGLLYARGAKDKCVRYPAFVPLFLTLSAALCGGMLTGDVFNFFVMAELLVISGTALTALSDDKDGAESAWKYFYLSTFAGMLLLGASGCLYAGYGTLNMADLSVLISADPGNAMLGPAAAMLVAALLIKAAAVPFHFWQPDFHTVSPTPVSAMLSGIVVKLGVYGLVRVMTLLMVPLAPRLEPLMLWLGIAGIAYGSLGAVGTHNLKRVLAYSTLAQVGFVMVGMGLGSAAALTAAIVFSFNHALAKSAMLMLAGNVASRAPVKSASFSVVTGVGGAMPLAGWLFVIGAMALVGMPPTNGFVSKLMLLVSAGDRPYLIAGLVLLSVLTMIYLFRAYARVWWEPMPDGAEAKPKGDSLLAPAGLITCCVLLGLIPGPLTTLSARTSAYLQEPVTYINAVHEFTRTGPRPTPPSGVMPPPIAGVPADVGSGRTEVPPYWRAVAELQGGPDDTTLAATSTATGSVNSPDAGVASGVASGGGVAP